MREKPPGLAWITTAAALILVVLLTALFIPVKA